MIMIYKTANVDIILSFLCTDERGSNLVCTEIERGMECDSPICLLGK